MEKNRIYAAIDLKSFYASVECIERGLDPLGTHLVVADASRTEKTICLAVSPSLKTYGIPGRARLFEVVQRIKEVNDQRLRQIPEHCFSGSSFDKKELEKNSHLAVDYVVATPRMAHYMEYSTRVYQIYLKYLAPEDIHVYSIDEIMCDVTDYPWTFWQNMWNQTTMGSELQNSMRSVTDVCFGRISQLRIFGGSDRDTQKNFCLMAFITWEMWRDVPLEKKQIIIMKNCCIGCLG